MQSTPSTMLFSQAVALLQQMQASFIAGTLQSPIAIAQQLSSILTSFDQSAGQPLLDFEYFEKGEPPISPKINGIWGDIELDTTILQNQVDILNASSLFANNVIVTNLLNASDENSAIGNKLDTLELYAANSSSGNLVVFSDSFGNSQLIDPNFISPSTQASVTDGILTLSPNGALIDLTTQAQVTVLGTSNGFLGNNQEIEDPSTAPVDPTTNLPIYEFVAQVNNANQISALTDNDPTTWIEYEYYELIDAQRAVADDYNFTYQELTQLTAGETTVPQIDWSIGPPNGVLELDLQFDFGSVQPFNFITFTPFGLTNNVNTPILVKQITTSPDGNTWTPVSPTNIWVGTNTNAPSLQTTQTYTIGDYVWAFDQVTAQYVNFAVQQPNPINVNVGHLYYEDETNTRQEGPVPSVADPAFYYNSSFASIGDLTQFREYFPGQRWAIGIQEIGIQQVNYQTLSSMVTLPLNVGGIVNRIALDADVWIPSDFDPTQSWINFYVSPDNGQSWFQINDIEDTSLGYPAVIAFNDPLPVQFQDPGVMYYTVSESVTTLRFRIDLLSPNTTETPLVRSYSLKVTTR